MTSMSTMSGVISPTNLSMYSSAVNTPRTTPRSSAVSRWTAPFITLDQEDFNMMSHQVTTGGTEPNAVILMDEGTYKSTLPFKLITSKRDGSTFFQNVESDNINFYFFIF